MKMRNGVKREREKVNGFKSKEERTEQIQADHELFLQAFEKPTQIYRYLRTRNLISPIFLNRNLTFMKKRMSRCHEARKNFKIDTLLEKRVKEDNEMCVTNLGSYMTLTFLGYYDNKVTNAPSETAQLELTLVKFCHKKRKEGSSPGVTQVLGTSEVPINPSEQRPPSKAPALSIPSKSFSLSGVSSAERVKSYSLMIKVNSRGENSENGHDENQEPSAKRRKGKENETDGDEVGRIVTAELVVYDKHSRCLLTEGEYELVLGEGDGFNSKISPAKKNSSWEIIDAETANMSSSQFSVFSQCPTLKFRLSWCSEAAGAMVERPRPLMPRDNGLENNFSRREKSKKERSIKSQKNSSENVTRIVYQFLYNNNSRQQTEAREDVHCPWCSLNCMTLYGLLKHLKLSHPRFLFTYVPIPEGARIDVSVSELYDSTYVGNPHDMISQPPGYAFSRNGPVQRTTITNILVCKPVRTGGSLSEFLELDNDDHMAGLENQRPFVSGHNRLYHYSTTCLPIPSHAILHGDDEEDHPDPEWLRIKTSKMIDDFTDVNAGEKEFMKMWNNHVQKFTFVGDCQMPKALAMFIDIRGQDIVQKNLFRNFSLHLVNLFEFGIIGPSHVFTAISRLQALVRSLGLHHGLSWANLLPSLATQMNGNSPNNRKSSKMRKNFAGIFNKSS